MEKVIIKILIKFFIILGTVGKTTIITHYIKGKFIKEKKRTINSTISKKNLILNGNHFSLVIWDTAGEEKYHALGPIFYNGTDGAIIVYDCTNKESFNRAEKWFQELKEICTNNPRIILVGNKIDLPNKVVDTEDGQNLARKYKANFFEISALSGNGIDVIFENITNEIYNYKLLLQKLDQDEEGENQDNKHTKRKLIISSERFEKRDSDAGSCCCCFW